MPQYHEPKELEPPKLARLITSAISSFTSGAVGYIAAGPIGGLIGAVSSAVDAYRDLQDHIFSRTLFYAKTMFAPSSFFLAQATVISEIESYLGQAEPFVDEQSCNNQIHLNLQCALYGTSVIISTVAGYWIAKHTEDFLKYEQRAMRPLINVYNTYQILDTSDPHDARCMAKIPKVFSNKFVQTVALSQMLGFAQIGSEMFFLKLLGKHGHGSFILTVLDQYAQNKDVAISPLVQEVSYTIALLIARSLLNAYLCQAQNKVEKTLSQTLEMTTFSRLLEIENMQKIMTLKNSDMHVQQYLQNVHDAIRELTQITMLPTIISRELVALGVMTSIAPDYLLIGLIKSNLKAWSSKLHSSSAQNTTHWEAQYKTDSLKQDIGVHIADIYATKSTHFISNMLKELCAQRDKSIPEYSWELTLRQQAQTAMDFLLQAVELLYYLSLLKSDAISLSQINIVTNYNYTVENFLSPIMEKYPTNNSGAARNTAVVVSVMSEKFEDDIKRTTNDVHKLIVSDYKLMHDSGAVMMEIPKAEFWMGRHYAVKGPSGLGKTSFILDMVGCLSAPLHSEGTISYPIEVGDPASGSIILISQNVYIPIVSTLFGAMTSKLESELTKDKIAELDLKITTLFHELKIAPDEEGIARIIANLHTSYAQVGLSGGQEKKLAIIKAIMSNPQILVMDESFNGLDPPSIDLAQNALSTHLKETMIIVIDHYAINNNRTQFYNFFFDAEKRPAELKPMEEWVKHEEVKQIGETMEQV